MTVRNQLVHDARCAPALPHDSVVHRLSGRPVPHDGGLSLIGDADTGNRAQGDLSPVERLSQGGALGDEDVLGSVLNPSRLRVYLFELQLTRRDLTSLCVPDHGPSAGRPFIERDNVLLRHAPLHPLRHDTTYVVSIVPRHRAQHQRLKSSRRAAHSGRTNKKV